MCVYACRGANTASDACVALLVMQLGYMQPNSSRQRDGGIQPAWFKFYNIRYEYLNVFHRRLCFVSSRWRCELCVPAVTGLEICNHEVAEDEALLAESRMYI